MSWKDRMTNAMEEMRKACVENDEWGKCHECPFDKFCTAIIDAGLFDPFEGINWNYAAEDE